ncbi:unannotated protein [freshwater metagenome]|uniref:Unannotated protein n=1 Tax=freshwater metagenome TaxID=449393 RepID=A0A6J7DY24_9ZZZZ
MCAALSAAFLLAGAYFLIRGLVARPVDSSLWQYVAFSGELLAMGVVLAVMPYRSLRLRRGRNKPGK